MEKENPDSKRVRQRFTALEEAVERTGVPRAIVNDYGSDLHGGVQFFQERHDETLEMYDIKHKAACLLKHRLANDPRWQEFQRQIGTTRCAIQQTELAFLAPPTPKAKARFMNLQPQLEWAEGVRDILRDPPAEVLQWGGAAAFPAPISRCLIQLQRLICQHPPSFAFP